MNSPIIHYILMSETYIFVILNTNGGATWKLKHIYKVLYMN